MVLCLIVLFLQIYCREVYLGRGCIGETTGHHHTMDEALVEKVLDAVDALPSGVVVSYGNIADLVGGTARQVGSIMAHHGHATAWWRVAYSDGRPPGPLASEAVDHWKQERVVMRSGRAKISLVSLKAGQVVVGGRHA